jgi:DNA excision repair protein ERCC-3
MTPLFYEYYLKSSSKIKEAIYINNPNKFLACQYLINLHESRGDKIIVFSDYIFPLKFYAKKLMKPFIYSDVSH